MIRRLELSRGQRSLDALMLLSEKAHITLAKHCRVRCFGADFGKIADSEVNIPEIESAWQLLEWYLDNLNSYLRCEALKPPQNGRQENHFANVGHGEAEISVGTSRIKACGAQRGV